MTAEQLKAWRERIGLSQAEAARALNNMSVRTYQDWEQGRFAIPV